MSESLADLLLGLQSLGFLEGRSWEECAQNAQAYWGVDIPYECDTRSQALVMLLCLDKSRVWHGQSNLIESPGCYGRLLEELSAVSHGLFLPRQIEAAAGRVSFHSHEYRYLFEPAAGEAFDMRILQVVNWAIMGAKQFECLDVLGMPNVALLATADERSRLETLIERPFVHSLTAAPDNRLRGFLSDFWEQGMEERPWLIFQDQRFCRNHRTGWDRAGMYRLKVGARLKIFDHEGGLLWQGTLGDDERGFWGRLTGKPLSVKPADVEQQTWDSWFKSRPPLRCFSSGIAHPFI